MLDTLPLMLQSHADKSRSDPTFIFLKDGELEEQRLTCAELHRAAGAIAGGLLQHCRRGDRVVLLFPTGPEFVMAFMGCLYAGVLAVPAYPPRASGRGWPAVRSILADAQAAVILTNSSLKAMIERLVELDSAGSIPQVLTPEPLLSNDRPLSSRHQPIRQPSFNTRLARPVSRRASSSPTVI